MPVRINIHSVYLRYSVYIYIGLTLTLLDPSELRVKGNQTWGEELHPTTRLEIPQKIKESQRECVHTYKGLDMYTCIRLPIYGYRRIRCQT